MLLTVEIIFHLLYVHFASEELVPLKLSENSVECSKIRIKIKMQARIVADFINTCGYLLRRWRV
jgi:hypothetical protein